MSASGDESNEQTAGQQGARQERHTIEVGGERNVPKQVRLWCQVYSLNVLYFQMYCISRPVMGRLLNWQ
jgi:hypothetical protein